LVLRAFKQMRRIYAYPDFHRWMTERHAVIEWQIRQKQYVPRTSILGAWKSSIYRKGKKNSSEINSIHHLLSKQYLHIKNIVNEYWSNVWLFSDFNM
jgi:hypothetical protein